MILKPLAGKGRGVRGALMLFGFFEIGRLQLNEMVGRETVKLTAGIDVWYAWEL